jgi:TonB dependent receptor-like, beta-barrel/Carboxypeptidase regulatory-like domain/TonB-dependent Receptor Plug Domain
MNRTDRRPARVTAFLHLFGIAIWVAFLTPAPLYAAAFGSVRGVVQDSDARPIAGASVKIHAAASDWVQTADTDARGEFSFSTVAIGDYMLSVTQSGFATSMQAVRVVSGSSPTVRIQLAARPALETVTVAAQAEALPATSATPTTLVSREDIERAPGASRSNSLAMITNYVPGAYVVHDQLHVRGGHQTTWAVDGVEIPNTNIASNLGPQIDPKDIDYLEVQRGSYEADQGDRTYGVFNVVPRTGFERNNEAELVASAGNFGQTNDYLSVGSHTDDFAYYASVNGNRSDLGIQTPVAQIIHDKEDGYGAFGTLVYDANPENQLRLVTSVRRDDYQIPLSPGDTTNDVQHEADAFAILSWVHTLNAQAVLTTSVFYHYNRANLDGAPQDFPISTTDHRASSYLGGQESLRFSAGWNDVKMGITGFSQHDDSLFGVLFNDGSNPTVNQTLSLSGSLVAAYVQDTLKPTQWLTLTGGVRQTHFSGAITENATSPRIGVSVQVPRINWVFRAFYGQYYQAPPLTTLSGPLLAFAQNSNLTFLPLHGERDKERQFGVTIPLQGWTFDVDQFRTSATNFFDHNPIGNSNVFFPITIDGALIRAWELTIRSPRLWSLGQAHLAYSNQIAQGTGAVSGGLTSFSPPAGYFNLDHDQRNTLNAGFDASLPWQMSGSVNLYYGSGFSNGAPPPSHLPGHTSIDLALGKSFGQSLSASITVLNLTNRHLLLDNSLTFGGFHYNNSREIYAELHYRFGY